MKFGLQVYHDNIQVKFDIGYDRAIFDRVMPLGHRKIQSICSFRSFSSWDEHTEMKFGIQVYHDNIQVKFDTGYDRAIFDTVLALGRRKIPVICSFH